MSRHVYDDEDGFGLNTFDFVANETVSNLPPTATISNNIGTQLVNQEQGGSQQDQNQEQQQQLEDTFLLFANAESGCQSPNDIYKDQQQQIFPNTDLIIEEQCLTSSSSVSDWLLPVINCHGIAAVQQDEDDTIDVVLNCLRNAFILIKEICSTILDSPRTRSDIQSDINGVLLLREKVTEVRKHIAYRAFTSNTTDIWTVLEEIDQEFEGLSAIIKKAEAKAAAESAAVESAAEAKINKPTNSGKQYKEKGNQMGLDLLNKVRRFFNLQSGAKESPIPTASEPARGSNSIGSGNGGLANQNSARKRRNQDEIEYFKYRRVDNTFPKFITNEATEDYNSLSNHTMAEHRDRMQRRSQTQSQQQQQQQLLQQDVVNPTTTLTRRSIFNAPQMTHTRIRNNSVNPSKVVIDLSDDDRELSNDMLPFDMFGRNSVHQGDMDRERDRCSLLSSSGMVRPQMLYSDAVRLNQNGGFSGGYTDMRLNGHSQPHIQETISVPATGCSLRDTILMQDEQRSDREQYINLIQSLSHQKTVTARATAPCHKSRLPTLPPPPPLHRIPKQSSNTETNSNVEWYRLLNKNKPVRIHLPASTMGSIEREQYAKLLDKGTAIGMGMGMVTTPPPPPLMRCNSATSATSHASTIHSSSTSSHGNNPSGSCSSSSSSSNSSGSVISYTTKPKETTTTVVMPPTGVDSIIELDDDSYDEKDSMKTTSKSNGSLTGNTPVSPSTSLLQQTEALQRRMQNCSFFMDDFENNFNQKCARQRREGVHSRELAQLVASKTTDDRRSYEQGLRENIIKYRIIHKPIFVIDNSELTPDEEKMPEFLPITDDLHKRYNELVHGPPQQVLVSKFSLNITRNDIRTLVGSMWLNDEVINFYMNLLTDRSQQKAGKLPNVYAMNTFFIPRLLQNGHKGVKRWTRKVNIFEMDIIPVPVHVGGVHWCMAIIHLKNKTIRYYDSMGKPNQTVLNALEAYLREESLDKRKQPFDTSDFLIENVPDVPQQTNGSDCGVFSCMFAEYITRNKQLTFSQEHMEYFRKKMILEICSGELWM